MAAAELPPADRSLDATGVALRRGLQHPDQGMDVLVLFTPEESQGIWRVRVFPASFPSPIPGLSDAGEASGLVTPDFGGLDERMLVACAGYSKRLHPSGVMEITATGRGADALYDWVAGLLTTPRTEG